MSVDPAAAMIDRRVIAFRPPTLLAAMQAVGRTVCSIPEAELRGVELRPSDQTVIFEFSDGQTRIVNHGQLGALLIAYTIAARVPLPTRATKTITVAAKGVVLDFVVTYGAAPRTVRR